MACGKQTLRLFTGSASSLPTQAIYNVDHKLSQAFLLRIVSASLLTHLDNNYSVASLLQDNRYPSDSFGPLAVSPNMKTMPQHP